MPGTRCTVATCNNSLSKTKKSGQDVIYFTFPKDELQRKIWVLRCRRGGRWNPETSRICSIHFTSDDFERDLQAELLGTKPKIVLKKSAIPTLCLGKDYSADEGRAKHVRSRSNRHTVGDLLQQSLDQAGSYSFPVIKTEICEEDFACHLCGEPFTSVDSLRDHLRKSKHDNSARFSSNSQVNQTIPDVTRNSNISRPTNESSTESNQGVVSMSDDKSHINLKRKSSSAISSERKKVLLGKMAIKYVEKKLEKQDHIDRHQLSFFTRVRSDMSTLTPA